MKKINRKTSECRVLLIDWLVGWLINWLVDWLIYWMIYRSNDWSIEWSIDRMIDWVIDILCYLVMLTDDTTFGVYAIYICPSEAHLKISDLYPITYRYPFLGSSHIAMNSGILKVNKNKTLDLSFTNRTRCTTSKVVIN